MIISKAEFDSQRGADDFETDGDLVFGPLDQDEAAAPTSASKSDSSLKKSSATSDHPLRGRRREREGHDRGSPSPSKGSPHSHQRRKKFDRRARFYPVLNKQESPSKVTQQY